MIPEPTGTTAVATNPEYAKLFAQLGAGSLAVGIALVVLIPFLRRLITHVDTIRFFHVASQSERVERTINHGNQHNPTSPRAPCRT